MSVFHEKFLAASPRYQRIATPPASLLIHGSVLGFFLVLLAASLGCNGLLAWSVGAAYIAYDTALLGFTTIQTASLARRRQPAAAAPGRRITLGAIIAAHNEANVLAATIQALLRQTDRADAILIADDGSTDSTQATLAGYALCPPATGHMAESSSTPGLFWLRLPHAGKATALNEAMRRLTTEIVLTVDADTLLEPTALAALRAAFAADPALVAATGVLSPVCGQSAGAKLFQWFQTYEYIRNFLSRFAWMRADGLLLISGACAGFRRAAVLEVGGFDPDCLVEDYELIHRLRRHAVQHGLTWHTGVLGTVRARTDAPASAAAFLRQRRRWFGGFLQTQFWYRDMVGNQTYGRLGTWMLPVKAADTLQPLFGLAAFVLLLWHLVHFHCGVLLPVSAVIAAKIGLDLCFHLWSAQLYRNWTGDRTRGRFFYALLAALLEPFSFQLLRHAGAALGWGMFLTGARGWGRQERRIPVAAE